MHCICRPRDQFGILPTEHVETQSEKSCIGSEESRGPCGWNQFPKPLDQLKSSPGVGLGFGMRQRMRDTWVSFRRPKPQGWENKELLSRSTAWEVEAFTSPLSPKCRCYILDGLDNAQRRGHLGGLSNNGSRPCCMTCIDMFPLVFLWTEKLWEELVSLEHSYGSRKYKRTVNVLFRKHYKMTYNSLQSWKYLDAPFPQVEVSSELSEKWHKRNKSENVLTDES